MSEIVQDSQPDPDEKGRRNQGDRLIGYALGELGERSLFADQHSEPHALVYDSPMPLNSRCYPWLRRLMWEKEERAVKGTSAITYGPDRKGRLRRVARPAWLETSGLPTPGSQRQDSAGRARYPSRTFAGNRPELGRYISPANRIRRAPAAGAGSVSRVPRTCTVCVHDERHQINVTLVQRQLYRAISRRFGPSRDALARYSRDHLPKLLVQASRSAEAADADDLLARVESLWTEALAVLEAAKGEADHRVVLAAIDRAGRQLELLGRLRGELREPTVNLHFHPEWLELRAVIVGALEPHPEARDAVILAMASRRTGANAGA